MWLGLRIYADKYTKEPHHLTNSKYLKHLCLSYYIKLSDKAALKLRTDPSRGDPLQCLLKTHRSDPLKILLNTPQMSIKVFLCALPTQAQCSLKTSSVPYFAGVETKRRQHHWPTFLYRFLNAQLNWPNSQSDITITSAIPRRKTEKL